MSFLALGANRSLTIWIEFWRLELKFQFFDFGLHLYMKNQAEKGSDVVWFYQAIDELFKYGRKSILWGFSCHVTALSAFADNKAVTA